MLQKIRDSLQSQRWLAILVLGALALVFAAWGAYGIVNINVGVGNYAAKVGSEKLSLEEVREDWMRQQSRWQQRFGNYLPLMNCCWPSAPFAVNSLTMRSGKAILHGPKRSSRS